MRLRLLTGTVAVARLEAGEKLPAWAATPSGPVWSVTRTADETSVTCLQELVPDDAVALRDLCALGLAEPPAPDAVGVMAELSTALAAAGIWLIALGTHDTDYVLVRAEDADRALALFP